VVAYEIGNESIKVEFSDGALYEYTYKSAGRDNIEEMKILAREGRGLNTYITQYVGKDYAAKLN
jgi:hypothetical protein